MLRLINLPSNQEQKWSIISQVTTRQYRRLRPGDRCVCVFTAQMFGHSVSSPGSSADPGQQPRHTAPSGRHIPLRAMFPFCQPGSAVQLRSPRQGPAHKAHTNSGLASSAVLPWGTTAKEVSNPTAILSAATALLSHPTSSSVCRRRPCSEKNRQRQDASCRMKWNCLSFQRHTKKKDRAEMKHWPRAKGDNCYMLSYSLDSFYNTKALANSFTLSLEDMGTPTHVTALQSMMLRAFWKMHLKTFNLSCRSCNSVDRKKELSDHLLICFANGNQFQALEQKQTCPQP